MGIPVSVRERINEIGGRLRLQSTTTAAVLMCGHPVGTMELSESSVERGMVMLPTVFDTTGIPPIALFELLKNDGGLAIDIGVARFHIRDRSVFLKFIKPISEEIGNALCDMYKGV